MVILNPGYGLDSSGFIVSDVHLDKVDPVYMPCIRESVKGLKKMYRQQLHSIYLYGSVARGEAVAFKSDVDLIAMFHSKLSSGKLDDLKRLAEALSCNYRGLVRDVGIAVAYYDYTVDPSNYYENAFLKECSVCIYGEDLGERFGPYKLTSEIAISFNGDIHESLTRTLKKLETASEENFKIISQNFARKLIRTYYSMVMVRSQIWSTRLHEQSEVIIHHFPNKEPVIRTLLNWIDKLPRQREMITDLFKKEGEWVSSNFTHEASISS